MCPTETKKTKDQKGSQAQTSKPTNQRVPKTTKRATPQQRRAGHPHQQSGVVLKVVFGVLRSRLARPLMGTCLDDLPKKTQ